MKVRLEVGDNYVTVFPAAVSGGGFAGPAVHGETIGPGQSWRGWKYRRLRAKGSGEHVLLTKAARAKLIEDVKILWRGAPNVTVPGFENQ